MEKHDVKKWLEEQKIAAHSDDGIYSFVEKQGKRQEYALRMVLPSLGVVLRQLGLDSEGLCVSNEGCFGKDDWCEAVSTIIIDAGDEREDPLGFEVGIWTGEEGTPLKDVENAGAIYYYFWHPNGDGEVGRSFDLQECFKVFLEYWKGYKNE